MKYLSFTEKELETLIWCVQAQTAKEAKHLLAKGEAPSKNETVQMLNEISKKAYVQLMANPR